MTDFTKKILHVETTPKGYKIDKVVLKQRGEDLTQSQNTVMAPDLTDAMDRIWQFFQTEVK